VNRDDETACYVASVEYMVSTEWLQTDVGLERRSGQAMGTRERRRRGKERSDVLSVGMWSSDVAFVGEVAWLGGTQRDRQPI
jgi:hypothetical protein